eukprot:6266117-Pyramimonas_sp.AAC.1
MYTDRLDWNGLDLTGMDWTGLEWTGLDWNGLDWTAGRVPGRRPGAMDLFTSAGPNGVPGAGGKAAAAAATANLMGTAHLMRCVRSQPKQGAARVRLVRRENILPTLPASDWSVVSIYPRFLCLIGPS